MSRTIFILVLLLIILHQDNWLWTDARLVFGFMPIGLFYHACLSVAAALVWWLAVRIAWPSLENGPNFEKGPATLEQETAHSSATTHSGRSA